MKFACSALTFGALLVLPSFAQDACLTVLDLNDSIYPPFFGAATPQSGEVKNPVSFSRAGERRNFRQDAAGNVYFTAIGDCGQSGLWRSDGTPQGTHAVRDVNPFGDDNIDMLTAAGGAIFFTGVDGIAGYSLFHTDGTWSGTQPIWTPDGAVPIQSIAEFNGQVVFGGATASQGLELMISDGTAAGTVLLLDINPAAGAGSNPREFATGPDGLLYFTADDGAHGSELWTSDGTSAGTQMLVDLTPGAASSVIDDFVTFGSSVLFEATVAGQSGLWITDGTAAGTMLLGGEALGAGQFKTADLGFATELAGWLYFSAYSPTTAADIWRTNGTVAGTQLVGDLGNHNVAKETFSLGRLGDRILFLGPGSSNQARSLWAIDAAGQLQLVTPDVVTTAPGVFNDYLGFEVIGDRAIFSAGPQMSVTWVTDGFASGTGPLVMPGFPDPVKTIRAMSAIGGGRLLTDGIQTDYGRELWSFDFNVGGVVTQVTPLESKPGYVTLYNDIKEVTEIAGGRVLFNALNPPNGNEPWMWSAAEGPQLVSNIGPSNLSSEPLLFADAWVGDGKRTFFMAKSEGTFNLWATDGTDAGTYKVTDKFTFNPYPFQFSAAKLTPFKKGVVFNYGSPSNPGLWYSDGTDAGTVQFLNGPQYASILQLPSRLIVLGDQILIQNGMEGQPDWISDGTVLGTHPISTLGFELHVPSSNTIGVEHEGRYYLRGYTVGFGIEPFVTDGTPQGSWILADVIPGPDDSRPDSFTVMRDLVYFFAARPGEYPSELWVTDGTPAGTHWVYSTPSGDFFQEMWSDSTLGTDLFVTTRGASGNQLWKTDGTAAGFVLLANHDVAELVPMSAGAYYLGTPSIELSNTRLYFTDGTPEGTHQVPGFQFKAGTQTQLEFLRFVDGHVLVYGFHADFGKELHVLATPYADLSNLGPKSADIRIKMNAPRLGQPVTIYSEEIAPQSPSVLVMSLPVTKPHGLLVKAGDANWIDLSSAVFLGIFPGGNWTYSQTIPNVAVLSGFTVNLQAFALPGGSLPTNSSNGLRAVLGQ